MVDIIK